MRKLTTSELNRADLETFKVKERMPVIVVLDNVRSAHNVGSVFRTCDAFAVECIYLCGVCAVPPNRELMKTAIGSTESMEWRYYPMSVDAIIELKSGGYEIVLAEQTDSSFNLHDFIPDGNKKYAIVFGNEVSGVSEELVLLADAALVIPQFGTKHSFNISIAAGIVLWDLNRKLQPKMKLNSGDAKAKT